MSRLRDRVAEAIRDRRLFEPGDTVAVAVSGGLDSVVLLELLCATRGRHGGELSVVTVDHGTRAGSAEDAVFVQRLATDRGLACRRVEVMVDPPSEDALRDARYTVFDGLDVDRIALAHHRDDQAETVLLRLLSGAGTRGLSGMAWRRGRYVRPLLDTSREDLLAFAQAHGLSWREDPSNCDPRYLRNRVRAELLPLLDALRPGSSRALSRAARLAAEDEALLARLAEESLPYGEDGWSTHALAAAPPPLSRRALLARLPGASAAHLDAILAATLRGTGTVSLSGGVVVSIEQTRVTVGHAGPAMVPTQSDG